jgi:hypothetical protein
MKPEDVFNELLAADRERWKSTGAEMLEGLIRRGCSYGGREMVRVLRPKFVSSGDYAYLTYICGVVMGAFRRLGDMVLESPDLMSFLGVTDTERELAEIEPLCPDPCAVARLDTFHTTDGPRFVELNGEAPAGPGYCEATTEAFSRHPLIQEVVRRTGAHAPSTMEGLAGGLLMAWRASGRSGQPRILITDYLDVPTATEFHIVADYLRRYGLEVIVEDTRQLEYQGERLVAQGLPIDLVYRRVLTNEFIEHLEDVQPFLDAYRDQNVVVVDPFRAKLVHKKSAFALLTGDFLGEDWLTREERRVIHRHVPWTRRVRDARVDHGGEEVDLLPYLLENRDEFVLKPSDDYGGRGVVIGWECSEGEFQVALEDALEGDFVAQERIRTVEEEFPIIDEDLENQPMIVDLDPYVYMGRVHGLLARLSAGALCNVTSGGGQTPVFLYPSP